MSRMELMRKTWEYMSLCLLFPLLICSFVVAFVGGMCVLGGDLIFNGFVVTGVVALLFIVPFVGAHLKYIIDIIFCSVDIFEGTVFSTDPMFYLRPGDPALRLVKLAESGEGKSRRKKFFLPVPVNWDDGTDEQKKKWTTCLAYNIPPPEGPVKFSYLKHSRIIVELIHVTPGKLADDDPWLKAAFDVLDELADEEEDDDVSEASEE